MFCVFSSFLGLDDKTALDWLSDLAIETSDLDFTINHLVLARYKIDDLLTLMVSALRNEVKRLAPILD